MSAKPITRFFYLRDEGPINPKTGKREKGFPVACVASAIIQVDDKRSVIRFAMSTHNPLDIYDPERAKQIAFDRLYQGRDYRVHEIVATAPNIKAAICEAIANTSATWHHKQRPTHNLEGVPRLGGASLRHVQVFFPAPKRARRAAELWLKAWENRKRLAKATTEAANRDEGDEHP